MATQSISLLLLFFLFPFYSQSLPIFLHKKWLRGSSMLLSMSSPAPDIPFKWFNQTLDHFTQSPTGTWKQRYWVNDTFWDKNKGPVFLMIGGEGEASSKWVLKGEMMVLAQKYSALAFQLEHRFYGQSQPAQNLSIDNLRYLTSQQALADLAHFHDSMVSTYSMTQDNRWIAFGGSYPGALAAWLRIKYPDIVYGSVASSAPVQAVVDFYKYLEVIGQSLGTSRQGTQCVDAIKSAFSSLDGLIKDPFQWSYVNKMFSLSSPGIKTHEDGKVMALALAGMFMGVVQYNNDSRGEEVYDMNELCDVMANATIGKPLERLVQLANKSGLFDNENVNFEDYLSAFTNETIDPENGARQWFYQTCNEFGYFQTSDSPSQPFGNQIQIDLYTIVCEKIYSIKSGQTKSLVADTNTFYGGEDIPKNITNIIFPNGSIDPWHALGITTNISDSLVAVFINGTAHCANMYPANQYDRPELVEARKTIDTILGGWLKV